MVRVSGCCEEDSEDEDQNSSDWNARNRGDDSQEIIPTTEEEGRQEGHDDGVERVESMEHVMENDNALGFVSTPLVSQACEARRTEVNAVITEVYVQSVEDQLAKIDAEITKFDAPNGMNGRIESETSNFPWSRPVETPGILSRVFLFHFEKISNHFSLFRVFQDVSVNTGQNSKFGLKKKKFLKPKQICILYTEKPNKKEKK